MDVDRKIELGKINTEMDNRIISQVNYYIKKNIYWEQSKEYNLDMFSERENK